MYVAVIIHYIAATFDLVRENIQGGGPIRSEPVNTYMYI